MPVPRKRVYSSGWRLEPRTGSHDSKPDLRVSARTPKPGSLREGTRSKQKDNHGGECGKECDECAESDPERRTPTAAQSVRSKQEVHQEGGQESRILQQPLHGAGRAQHPPLYEKCDHYLCSQRDYLERQRPNSKSPVESPSSRDDVTDSTDRQGGQHGSRYENTSYFQHGLLTDANGTRQPPDRRGFQAVQPTWNPGRSNPLPVSAQKHDERNRHPCSRNHQKKHNHRRRWDQAVRRLCDPDAIAIAENRAAIPGHPPVTRIPKVHRLKSYASRCRRDCAWFPRLAIIDTHEDCS